MCEAAWNNDPSSASTQAQGYIQILHKTVCQRCAGSSVGADRKSTLEANSQIIVIGECLGRPDAVCIIFVAVKIQQYRVEDPRKKFKVGTIGGANNNKGLAGNG